MTVTVDGVAQVVDFVYKPTLARLEISAVAVSPTQTLVVTLAGVGLPNTAVDKQADVLHLLHHFRLDSNIKADIAHHLPDLLDDPTHLFHFISSLTNSQRRALLETITEVGMHFYSYQPHKGQLVLWNNHGREDVQFAYHYRNEAGWGRHQFTAVQDTVPHFRQFTHQPPDHLRPEANISWQAALTYEQVGTVTISNE